MKLKTISAAFIMTALAGCIDGFDENGVSSQTTELPASISARV